ncbi:MAG: hypothetical protein A2836_00690 [Candidatus Taylorbacteria bacterium RIFCSPHIGHO2_01_FULL_45_63]|uniref:Uncharacterized protein n=1 Tax=Candidatus Taylorbacteria bacterium RIFCSPHIGHO2_02_FULL_45_35 TaxID=1802311 RepID=A0A1G2MTG4_9BACT|nr:MAG: hypothetical protein A2836_00690 [Candidatus Taylorbacteria bacterium RIFCSPHIGHO2_01_FULL_45_63]OHA27136.1 MAG: hypothetical protein A3D56_03390 [Candidatus Taylorbacteria bacterium RIFCSPHIGHO2_02_FULL_45_35]
MADKNLLFSFLLFCILPKDMYTSKKSRTWVSGQCNTESHLECPFHSPEYRKRHPTARCNCTCHKARKKPETKPTPPPIENSAVGRRRRYGFHQQVMAGRLFTK